MDKSFHALSHILFQVFVFEINWRFYEKYVFFRRINSEIFSTEKIWKVECCFMDINSSDYIVFKFEN